MKKTILIIGFIFLITGCSNQTTFNDFNISNNEFVDFEIKNVSMLDVLCKKKHEEQCLEYEEPENEQYLVLELEIKEDLTMFSYTDFYLNYINSKEWFAKGIYDKDLKESNTFIFDKGDIVNIVFDVKNENYYKIELNDNSEDKELIIEK